MDSAGIAALFKEFPLLAETDEFEALPDITKLTFVLTDPKAVAGMMQYVMHQSFAHSRSVLYGLKKSEDVVGKSQAAIQKLLDCNPDASGIFLHRLKARHLFIRIVTLGTSEQVASFIALFPTEVLCLFLDDKILGCMYARYYQIQTVREAVGIIFERAPVQFLQTVFTAKTIAHASDRLLSQIVITKAQYKELCKLDLPEEVNQAISKKYQFPITR